MKRLLFLAMMISATFSLFAQRTVEGTVSDSKSGETLIGVAVMIKGTTTGTITDIDGKYRLASDQLTAESVIVYSYMGFTSLEQITGDRTVIDVK
ncbi:MAG: carboxypeptidase-like regulatory domain-containing protein, partial [Bacteroidota bacterium]|nr:carboxypeptidase-like regulatory domain-containing protein [Bacteroidota bacterium]